MARNDKKRQKKLEKKRMERKKKLNVAARIKSGGLAVQMADAAKWPIFKSIDLEVEDDPDHLLQLILVRRCPKTSQFAFVMFTVDTYCCGVKDVFARILNADLYAAFEDAMLKDVESEEHPLPPAHIRKLVEESVDFALSFGLKPDPNYAKASAIFGDIDVASCTTEFKFGIDGKPHYISDSADSPEQQINIAGLVRKANGKISVGPDRTIFGVDFDQLAAARERSRFNEDFEDDFDDEYDDDDEYSESPTVLETTYEAIPPTNSPTDTQ